MEKTLDISLQRLRCILLLISIAGSTDSYNVYVPSIACRSQAWDNQSVKPSTCHRMKTGLLGISSKSKAGLGCWDSLYPQWDCGIALEPAEICGKRPLCFDWGGRFHWSESKEGRGMDNPSLKLFQKYGLGCIWLWGAVSEANSKSRCLSDNCSLLWAMFALTP